MTGFRQIFAHRHVVLPVIHVESEEQALGNAGIAREAGADGVFFINHSIDHQHLLAIHHRVFHDFRDWWIGVNCLDLDPVEVFGLISDDVAGVWADDAAIDERNSEQPVADEITAVRERSGWAGLYFGGVAFKYQRSVEDVASAARIATRYMDVVTTSGPGTGVAAAREKILAMREAADDFPLAIASGITPDNVGEYLEIADCFLVATGISRSFSEIDAGKLQRLLARVRAYAAR